MIGTIAITSSLASPKPNHNEHQHQHHQHQQEDTKQHYPQQQQQQQLWRSPSVLQRLKSINLYSYRSQEPQISTVALLQRLKSFNPYNYLQHAHVDAAAEEEKQDEQGAEANKFISRIEREEEEAVETLDEIYNKLQSSNKVVGRSMSDTKPVGGEIPKKLPKKMKKSASTKSAFGHFEEEKIVEARRPATVREQKSNKLIKEDEVDAKADDFINKFKQQLKLQRLDSIIRYKEMVGRGSTK
ncbi:Pathogen-associated molecular patterns-induced protein A70 [Linum grandiflorum]